MFLTNGEFQKSSSKPSHWIHVVLNYIGPNNGEGIRIYYDGTLVASDISKYGSTNEPGNGRIVVGKFFTNRNSDYASVQVDELMFFNQTLTSDEVQAIYNSA